MKLNRREFLRMLGIGAAGAALGAVAGTGEPGALDELPDPAHELEPFAWSSSSLADCSSLHIFDAAPEKEIIDRQPEWQPRQVHSCRAMPSVMAGDLLAVNDLGYLKRASSRDWIFGYAVSDADADGYVMVCGDPGMVTLDA